MRRIKKALWLVLALAFLLEAWAWAQLQPLLRWLRQHIHQAGRRKQAVELITSVTGKAPSAGPFLEYLERKYGALYGV